MSMARVVSSGSVIAGAGIVRHAGLRGRERRLPGWSAWVVLGAWSVWVVACSSPPTDNTQSATQYTLTVANNGTGSGTVTGSGIACGADCTETVANGTSITLAAAAATGSTFVSWTGCDAPSGTSCTMSMTAHKSVTATFNSVPVTYTLTVVRSGTGSGTVTGTGISCGTDCTETVASGTAITLTAAAAAGSTFGSWTGCDTPSGASCTMSMTANKTVTATFNSAPVTYTLTVAKNGTGSGTVTGTGISCGTDCTETVASGTSITLTAAAAAGSTFGSWTGCDTPSGVSCTMSMTANKTVTATLNSAPVTYTLTVMRSGTGSGTVTGSGIACGADCTETVASGTAITLTAAPATGSVFVSWTGCDALNRISCTMSMSANKTVTATFNTAPVTYTLTVTKDGTGSGTVAGAGISCGTDCTETVASGTSITLTASPAAGSAFASWTGCNTASGTSCTVSMTANKTVAVTFITAGVQTITLKPQYDNLVMINTQDTRVENTVYQSGPLAVGCNWVYNDYLGYQDAVCAQSLARFDLSPLAGKMIISATLTLTTDQIGVGFFPRYWSVQALATAWSPSTVTWNVVKNLSVYTVSKIVQAPPTYHGQIFNIDFTTYVKYWVGQTWSNYGIILGSEDLGFPNATSFDAFQFFSLEDTGREWPTLTVTYQ